MNGACTFLVDAYAGSGYRKALCGYNCFPGYINNLTMIWMCHCVYGESE